MKSEYSCHADAPAVVTPGMLRKFTEREIERCFFCEKTFLKPTQIFVSWYIFHILLENSFYTWFAKLNAPKFFFLLIPLLSTFWSPPFEFNWRNTNQISSGVIGTSVQNGGVVWQGICVRHLTKGCLKKGFMFLPMVIIVNILKRFYLQTEPFSKRTSSLLDLNDRHFALLSH